MELELVRGTMPNLDNFLLYTTSIKVGLEDGNLPVGFKYLMPMIDEMVENLRPQLTQSEINMVKKIQLSIITLIVEMLS